MKHRVAFLVLILLIGIVPGFSQNEVNNVSNTPSVRQHLLMDFGWKFSYGHGKSFENDFLSGTGYFSYFAKPVMVTDLLPLNSRMMRGDSWICRTIGWSNSHSRPMPAIVMVILLSVGNIPKIVWVGIVSHLLSLPPIWARRSVFSLMECSVTPLCGSTASILAMNKVAISDLNMT